MGILDPLLGKKKQKITPIPPPAPAPAIPPPAPGGAPPPSNKPPIGFYLINPGATFELTLHNADEDKIYQFVNALNQNIYKSYNRIKSLVKILCTADIRCREIDAYVDIFRPKFEQIVKELIEKHPKWKDANEYEKKDILCEIRQKALSMLYVQPDVDLEILFRYYPWDDPLPSGLFQAYPVDVILEYIGGWDEDMKVKCVPTGREYRKLYEKMVELGLAIRGREIDTEKILMTMKMDQLRDTASKLNIKIPGKKKNAVIVLSKLEGIDEYIDKNVNFRELFQLIPLPEEYKSINIEKVRVFIDYCGVIADLIGRTYTFAYQESTRYPDSIRDFSGDDYRYYKVSCASDDRTCPLCKELSKRRYSKKDKPNPPFHLACRCAVDGVI